MAKTAQCYICMSTIAGLASHSTDTCISDYFLAVPCSASIPSATFSRTQPSSLGTNIHMQPVICHTIIVIVHTVGRKEEIVVKNAKSGLNVHGDLFPTQSTFLGAITLILDSVRPTYATFPSLHIHTFIYTHTGQEGVSQKSAFPIAVLHLRIV